VDPALLRKARFYLNSEGQSVVKFVNFALQRYVEQQERLAAEDVRAGARRLTEDPMGYNLM